jgi:hypothetical protein
MSQIAFWILLIFGLFMLIVNIIAARDAGKPRKNPNYPSGSLYAIDALIGVVLVLIAFGVI